MGSESRHRNVAPSRDELAEALARAHRLELDKSRELLRRAEHEAAEDPQARSVRQWFTLLVDELRTDSTGKQTTPDPHAEDRAAPHGSARPALGRQTLVIREGRRDDRRDDRQAGEAPRPASQRLELAQVWRMSQALGFDLTGVAIHPDSPEATGRTRAVVKDGEVHFRGGEYRPGTPDGDWLIAHELAHVVQQRGGRGEQAGSRRQIEREADRAASLAVMGYTAPIALRAQANVAYAYDEGEAHAHDAHGADHAPAPGERAAATDAVGGGGASRRAPAPLFEELLAAARTGHGAAAALKTADPTTAASALRELRRANVPGHAASALQLVARADGGEAARALGRDSTGAPLPDEVAARLGPHVGAEAVGAARVHTDDAADLVAAAHHARAVALGDAIYFARGEYAPGTERGDELLAHELTHVAQARRGDISHAAAKGLESGNTLDPSEAEADLRAKLAVIQLHLPAGAAPALAVPSGAPTSAGDRAAKIAAQQQRMTVANGAVLPGGAHAAPPTSRPEAAVAHQPPPVAPAPAPASTGNAYVDTMNAPPSKQATELWEQVGTKATTQETADQAKFDGSLKPMPVLLDGSEPKGGKGGGGSAAAVSAKPAAGAKPPAMQPTPTPPAPSVSTAADAAASLKPNADKAQMKVDGERAMAALPTSSPDVKTDPGPAPVTDLAGQADPVRTLGDQRQAATDGAKALEAEKQKILSGPGAAQVQPAKLDEKLNVPKATNGGAMPALPSVDGMAKFKSWNLPSSAQAVFDDVAKPKMDATLADAKSKMTQAGTKRDTDREKAVTDANEKVKQAHADADKQQQAKVAETRTQIANKQADTLVKQEGEVKKLDQQAGDKKKGTISKIDARIQADQAKVDADYKGAQQKAEEQKKKGEADAEAKKKKAKEDAEKDKSWWEQATDAICDGIQAIADEIDHALEAIGQAIGQILDAVKDAACSLIDAASAFVCSALSEFGDWLKSAVTAMIGSVFPELAAALNQMIDAAVNAAKSAVTAIADNLKKSVTALCDGLKGAIDAVIAAYRAAVQAAATLAKALVTGDWKLVGKMVLDGILKLLGIDPAAFYALIGKAQDSIDKIIENPGAFVGHLVDAVKLGFQQFGTNFWSHLKDGLVQWLFGTFAGAGLRMPASFDIAGIFDLVGQVLGLTWSRMRVKVVKAIGEKNTERLEFVAGYIEALMSGGLAGLWAKVQQDMSSLWDMVVGGIKSWLIEKVVQQAIIKLATMWNPAGAIIQLIQTAWNVYQWVKENAQRIFGLVQAVVDSISNIVAGNIGGAANYIEQSLAKLVPIAISLLANLIGLGGISDKIKGIIEKVQTTIDTAIDKLIARVTAMFKGKDGKAEGKDGDKKDGDKDKKDDKKDGPKQVGARITFQAHGETHTQYIDSAGAAPVAMVASTPSAVKAKIEEWRPRLRELPEADQKRAGKLIGKAIAIEKKVGEVAAQVKSGGATEAALEAKQRELADTLAGLFEVMAPDMDPAKGFADQDPQATLKSPQYGQFKGRFVTLASSLSMPAGPAKAQEIWLQVVTALQKTDAGYKAAPNAGSTGRKDLSTDAFKKLMTEFEPITAALAPYMEKYAHGKKSWAFWSGKPAVEVAKKHGEVCLEKSALGSLFDGINISGGWDIQMWASLSKAYATHAAANVSQAKYAGFVGLGSSADQSIFNKIEQPQFVGMLSEKDKATIHVDWYAVAGDPKTDMKQPDWRFKAGGFDGVYGVGERGAMVALAESENKRRLELFKDKGVDEGPGGASATEAATPVKVPIDMHGAAHTITVTPGPTPKVEMASTPGLVKNKVDTALKDLRAQDPAPVARINALEGIRDQAGQIETLLATPGTAKPAIETAVRTMAAAIRSYGTTYGAHDIEDSLSDALLTPEQKKELVSSCAAYAKQIKAKGDKAKFLSDPKTYILGDKASGKQPKLMSGDLVEGVGADKVKEQAAGATVWRNPHLQFQDAGGKDVGGKQAELDFLLLSASGVQEIVSAKMNADNVRPSTDRGSLSKYYLAELDPLDLVTVGTKFGDAKAYRNATQVVLRYQDESGAWHSVSLAAFRAAHPLSGAAVGVKGLAPKPEPGEPPVSAGTLTLDVTKSELVEIAIIEIKKRLA